MKIVFTKQSQRYILQWFLIKQKSDRNIVTVPIANEKELLKKHCNIAFYFESPVNEQLYLFNRNGHKEIYLYYRHRLHKLFDFDNNSIVWIKQYLNKQISLLELLLKAKGGVVYE